MSNFQPLSFLLVEDDEDAVEIISSMLNMRFPEAQMHSAGNGKAGLDSFQRNMPDIVITDINMPGQDGVQLLTGIIDIRPETEIIVVTAHSDRQNLDRITSTGARFDIIYKPIDFKLLFASIECRIASLASLS